MKIFNKSLEAILAPFEKMKRELAEHATEQETVAARKTARAHSLNSQATSHLVTRDTARRIAKNLEGLF